MSPGRSAARRCLNELPDSSEAPFRTLPSSGALARENGFLARLLAACQGYLTFGAEHPNLYALLFARNPVPQGTRGEPAPDLRLHENGGEGTGRLIGAESFELLVHDVAAATAAGASQSKDPFVTATAIWVALHGLVLLRTDAPRFPWPDRTQLEDALLGRIALLHPLAD